MEHKQTVEDLKNCLRENDTLISSLCALLFYNYNEINCPYAVGKWSLLFLFDFRFVPLMTGSIQVETFDIWQLHVFSMYSW